MRFKNLFLFFGVGTVICSLANIFRFVYATQSGTGFLITRLRFLGIALTLFSFFVVACTFVFSLFIKERPTIKTSPDFYGAVIAFMTSASLAFDIFSSANGGVPVWQFNIKQILGILTVLLFAAYGIFLFIGKKLPSYSFAVAVFFFVFQIIVVFTSYATLAVIVEHIFELAALCMTLIFMLVFANAFAGYGASSKKLLSSGLAAAMLNISSFVSRWVTVIAGCSDKLHGEYPLAISEVFISAFIIWVIVCTYKEEKGTI